MLMSVFSAGANQDLVRYATILRNENKQLREELSSIQTEMRNHIRLTERRFAELYRNIGDIGETTTHRGCAPNPQSHMPLRPTCLSSTIYNTACG